MNWMPGVEQSRSELRELNELNFARIDSRFTEADARNDARFRAVDARFRDVDTRFAEMDRRFVELREEMRLGFAQVDVKLATLEGKIDRRFADLIKWSFVFWVGAVAAAALARV